MTKEMNNSFTGTIVEAGTEKDEDGEEGQCRVTILTTPEELMKLEKLPFYKMIRINLEELPESNSPA